MLDVVRLGFAYKGRAAVLSDVTFSVSMGDSVCLLGPNGTGKTTLLRCLLGLSNPSSGRVRLNGRDLRTISGRERASLLAYVPQASALGFPYPVYQVVLMGRVAHLRFGCSPRGRDHEAAQAAIDRTGISHLVDRPFQELSGGERQLVLIARALAQQAQVLILDEPTAALDFANQMRVLEIVSDLANEGLAVIMTSHSPDHAFLASRRVLMLREGGLYQDGPTQEIITPEVLSQLYDTATAVVATGIASPRGEIRVCVPLFDNLNWKESV